MNKPLTDDELDYLEQFLLNRIDETRYESGMDEGVFCLPMFDGYCSAIVSGPATILPSVWFEDLWGQFPPEWQDEEEVIYFMDLVSRHMNNLIDLLTHQPESVYPLWDNSDKGNRRMDIEFWASGYARGMALAIEDWHIDDPTTAAALDDILLLCDELEFSDLLQKPAPAFDQHAEKIAPAIRQVYRYWYNVRANTPDDQIPLRRKAHKIGRNEPCPCGSGKKYKQCCLH